MTFRKFPSIEQFKNVIKQVSDHCKYNDIPRKPILQFTGTVKLHGTNSCIGLNVNTGELFTQSRERIITPGDDNYGFSSWANNSLSVKALLSYVLSSFDVKETVHIYGEWAGTGIQKNVGIAQFNKSFYIFSVVVDGVEVEIDSIGDLDRIYFIQDFQQFSVDIDFENLHESQNVLIDYTLKVEEKCPVSAQLAGDIELETYLGEGIVWYNKEYGLRFKTKGEKHSNSKVKTLKQIAAVDIEKINSIKTFVENSLTENRLNQGIEKLKEMGLDPLDMKNTPEFIRWCVSDVLREERDTIEESEFDSKILGKKLSAVARTFFKNYS